MDESSWNQSGRKGKDLYQGKDLPKSQVLSSEWKTERVREDASGDSDCWTGFQSQRSRDQEVKRSRGQRSKVWDQCHMCINMWALKWRKHTLTLPNCITLNFCLRTPTMGGPHRLSTNRTQPHSPSPMGPLSAFARLPYPPIDNIWATMAFWK